MIKKIFYTLLFLCISYISYAQPTGGSLVIEQDSAVTKLISKPTATKKNDSLGVKKTTTIKTKTKTTTTATEKNNTNTSTSDAKVISSYGGCIPYPTNGLVNGYKIQIDRFKTQSEANARVNTFARAFPNTTSTIKYEAPNYKIYVGNYLSAKSMEADLKKIKKKFPGSFSVQSKVYIDKAVWNSRYCNKNLTNNQK